MNHLGLWTAVGICTVVAALDGYQRARRAVTAPGRGHIYAFEPSPVNAMLLRRHVLFNGMTDRVSIFERPVVQFFRRIDIRL